MTVSTNSMAFGVTLLIAASIGYLAHWGFSGTIMIDVDEGFKITVKQDQSLDDVFKTALKESPDRVAAVLAKHSYFKVDSGRLREAFSTLNPTDVSTNVVLVMLWQKSLAREGIFVQRRFPAMVILKPDVPNSLKIFACPGGALSSDYIVDILTRTTFVRGKLDQHPDNLKLVADCDTDVVSAKKLLTKKAPIRFWLSQKLYNILYPDVTDGSPQEAQFIVYPRHLATPLPGYLEPLSKETQP